MQVLGIGEILWDVFPDRELLGGAALNFSVNMVRLGWRAALLTAVGCDERGLRARKQASDLGVRTDLMQSASEAITGVAYVSFNEDGEPVFEIPRPAAFDFVKLSSEDRRAIKIMGPDWLYFGTLLQMEPRVEEITHELVTMLPGTRRFYDLNLRPHAWTLPLVDRLCGIASILKLNDSEARTLAALSGTAPEAFSVETFCRGWAKLYKLETICVTHGADGCSIFQENVFHVIPGYPAVVNDTVGAGDGFAAAFLYGLDQGWPVVQTGRFANAVGATIASRPGATPEWSLGECLSLASGSAGVERALHGNE